MTSINKATASAYYFYNSGQIDIDDTGNDGLYGFLVTENSGTINITNAGDDGIHIDDSRFTNSGTVTVNSSANFEINGEYGPTAVLENTGTIKSAGDFTFQNQDMGGTRRIKVSSYIRVCLNFDFGEFLANFVLYVVIFLAELPAFDCEKCLVQNKISSQIPSNPKPKHTLRLTLLFLFFNFSKNEQKTIFEF